MRCGIEKRGGPVSLRRMITIIAGTARPGSNTLRVAKQIEALHRRLSPAEEADTRLLDLGGVPAECWAPESYNGAPASFAPFKDAILASDGLVVVTPEYNGGMPGVLKFFIDLLPFPESFDRRPTCFVGLSAGRWGALRPVEHLQQIFGYRNAHIFPERVFLPGIGDLLDDRGELKDPALVERLEKQADGFRHFVRSLRETDAGETFPV